MNATPENFKPGERWLIAQYSNIAEVQCLEWSQSGLFVKVQYARGGTPLWLSETLKLLERLPDVESGNNQTGQTGGVEAAGGVVAYSRGKLILSLPPAFCEEIEAMLEIWRKEQFAKIEPGRTFSVIPSEDTETKA